MSEERDNEEYVNDVVQAALPVLILPEAPTIEDLRLRCISALGLVTRFVLGAADLMQQQADSDEPLTPENIQSLLVASAGLCRECLRAAVESIVEQEEKSNG